MQKALRVTCRTGPSPSVGNDSADSLPMRNGPPSRRTILSSDPAVARGRAADIRVELSMRARRSLVGTQQGRELGGIQLAVAAWVAGAACAAGTKRIWARERSSATARR